MNSSIIRYILGSVLKLEGALMALPCLVSVIYKEKEGLSYLAVALGCLVFGFLLTFKKPKDTVFYLKEGCVSTALSWIMLSIFGCIPFVLTKEIPSFTNALFETISGLTTTGATILDDVESLSHTSMFWRSFTHWIGGMGVLVFLLAVVPLSGGSNVNLMRAESPGPSFGKLVPKLKTTARLLYLIYFGLTIIQIILLICGRMPVFDAITTSFGTAGTGGFGIKNDSIAGYSLYIKWVVTIFMILFGVNFNAYYLILYKKFKSAFAMEEVKAYLIIIIVSVVCIFFNILKMSTSAVNAITDSAFQVASIITTTGFFTTDFNLWPEASKTILVILMFIGACAGSTGGGIKVSRLVILIKSLGKETDSYIHPKIIKKIKMDGKPVEHEVVRSVNVYFLTFIIIFTVSVLLVSLENKDFTTNFTAVAATINNVGPGLSKVGPICNFGGFSALSKYVMMFDMLAGRLELFPLLILFHPAIIREIFSGKRKSKA